MIDVRDLRKEFRVAKHHRGGLGAIRNLVSREATIVRAVDGVSFHIRAGELVGYLGPNGAGKSTTLKILTGILVPTSGEVVVAGRVPWEQRRQHVQSIGAVFGQRTGLWWDLPVIESLDLLRHIYRVPEATYRRNMALFGDLLGVDQFLDTPVRSLSLGQRMRADLAAALLHTLQDGLGADADTARRTVHERWPNGGLSGQLSQDLPTWTHFEQAAANVTVEQASEHVPCGPDPEPVVAVVDEFVSAGYDHLYFHQVGPDQRGFFEFWTATLQPALAAAAHRSGGSS